jgi:hypothetical protein
MKKGAVSVGFRQGMHGFAGQIKRKYVSVKVAAAAQEIHWIPVKLESVTEQRQSPGKTWNTHVRYPRGSGRVRIARISTIMNSDSLWE